MDYTKYEYRVFWSEERKTFVGKVTEFPNMIVPDFANNEILESSEDALAEIQMNVKMALEDFLAAGEKAPIPLYLERYSGKLSVRMPKNLHRDLAIEARRQNVSLNQLIVSRLAARF